MTKRFETLALLAGHCSEVSYELCHAIEHYSKGLDSLGMSSEKRAIEIFETIKKLLNEIGWDTLFKKR